MTQSSPEIKALIWDVDGVLVDTERLHWLAWRQMFTEEGKTLTLPVYQPFIGRGGGDNMRDLCAKLNVVADREALTRRRREIYRQLRQRGIPVIGENVALVRQFTRDFPALIQVVASSSRQSDIRENLAAAGLTDAFQFAVSFEDRPGLKRKPAPDLYLAAVAKIGLPAASCLAFEDTEHGVAAAKTAGVRCVALPNALTAGQDFSAADLTIAPGIARQAKEILENFT
ncbi:MAG: HAD family phosphatase [Patescibacteria group bacterium]